MPRRATDLDALIRLRKWEVDEHRRVLAALVQREADLVLFGRQLDLQLQREAQVAANNPIEGGRLWGAFLADHRKRRERLAETLAQVREQIERAREELADAYRVRRTTEEVRENRAEREAKEAARLEQNELDEIGQNSYLRGQGG